MIDVMENEINEFFHQCDIQKTRITLKNLQEYLKNLDRIFGCGFVVTVDYSQFSRGQRKFSRGTFSSIWRFSDDCGVACFYECDAVCNLDLSWKEDGRRVYCYVLVVRK